MMREKKGQRKLLKLQLVVVVVVATTITITTEITGFFNKNWIFTQNPCYKIAKDCFFLHHDHHHLQNDEEEQQIQSFFNLHNFNPCFVKSLFL